MAIKQDELNMWRALTAFAVSDYRLSMEEQNILSRHLKKANLSTREVLLLKQDLRTPQNVEYFYNKIQSNRFKKRFCEIARTLVWCDGDITRQEKEILKRVSCFESKEASKILKDSGKSVFIQNYIKSYENIAFINDNAMPQLFEQSA